MGEPVPGQCMTSTLPIDDGMRKPWAPDLWHVREALRGLLEGGGVPMVEPLVEEDKEERRPLAASKVASL